MADPVQTPDPKPEGSKVIIPAFTIEICSSNNASVMCPITRKTLRGRWENQNVKGGITEGEFARMPNLPGMCITVNFTEKTITIFDGATVPSFRGELQVAMDICKKLNFGDSPEQTVTLTGVKEDRLKTQIYWCRRWLDCKQAVIVTGRVPSMEVIESLPGRIEKNQFDSSPARDRFPDPSQVPSYVPPPFAQQRLHE